MSVDRLLGIVSIALGVAALIPWWRLNLNLEGLSAERWLPVAAAGLAAALLLPRLRSFLRVVLRELESIPSGLVCVEFLQGYPPYNRGEIAGFNRDQCMRFVKAGVAKYYRRRDRVVAWWQDFRRLGS